MFAQSEVIAGPLVVTTGADAGGAYTDVLYVEFALTQPRYVVDVLNVTGRNTGAALARGVMLPQLTLKLAFPAPLYVAVPDVGDVPAGSTPPTFQLSVAVAIPPVTAYVFVDPAQATVPGVTVGAAGV